jgi:hypothetical protein
MHWSDLLIIYLSCGAPFGVHFFLQNRKKTGFGALLLRSFGAGLLWIAYAYLLWRKNFAKRLTKAEVFSQNPEISLLEQQTSMLQEQILQSFIALSAKSPLNYGFFAFRDVLERYVGLTLAEKACETTAGEIDFEVFRIAGRKKKELPLAGKCLARKNSMHLRSHQCNAREDFLKLMASIAHQAVQISGSSKESNISFFKDLILELFELIDVKTLQQAEDIFDARPAETENGLHMPEVIECQPQPQLAQLSGPSRTKASPSQSSSARAMRRSGAE